MKKTLTAMIAATILATGSLAPVESGFIDDVRQRFESIGEETRNHESLVNTVQNKYNRISERNNNNEDRTKDFKWEFYDLTDMPPKDDKRWSFGRDNYKSADGTSDAVFYINKNTALVGIKSYYETFTGDVKRYNYVAEKYAKRGSKWNYVGDYHNCTTDSRDRPITSSQSLLDKLENWLK